MEKADGTDVESGQSPSVPHWKLVWDQGLITPEVLKWQYDGAGTEDDPYVVDWIDNDPRNPMLFSKVKKWSITLLVAVATLAVAFVSSAYTGGVEQIIKQFGASTEVVTLGVSLFVLGFAIGPLLWAPMSELWGRQILYIVTYGALTAFNAGAAGSQNMATLIILRFFAGAFGSSPLTNAGGVIADMFPAKERGLAMSIFSVAPFMGPTLGPIVGGFLGESEGWRWVEGLMAIFTGTLWIIGALLIPETYPPVLLRKRATALSKKTGKIYRSRADVDAGPVSASQAFGTALSRPWILLFREPIVLLLSIYLSIIYGTLYMMFGAFPIVYQQERGWSEGIGGLAFLGVAVGMIIAVLYTIFVGNKQYIKAVNKAGQFAPPEARLPPSMIGGIALPLGLFWFAWTNAPSVQFMASIAAGVPFGFGMVLVFLSVMNYLIDAYTIFAASVLAASSVLRSLFGAAFPLFTNQMYARLGIHWASSIPAFLALACVPLPFLFFKYGSEIRKRCKYSAEADAFMRKIIARRQAAVADEESDEDYESEHMDEAEEKVEEGEVVDDEPERPRFESIQTGQTPPITDRDLTRTRTGRSSRTSRSRRSASFYYDNPYEIDRVNTRESFGLRRSRATSDPKSLRKTRTAGSTR
ncbi:MFS general substrate transporter [Lepidopterella palustris CBS 459.81]|uniref:MFS general substrate transporter n=1 Tax=Lepidopterella palustris CBS 459.81 TaxID=1314670 RepID=A0A8E2JC72_9PEZI|nr:MFS general substrate transporter [Lepidopterella palustris CBS 459.81]